MQNAFSAASYSDTDFSSFGTQRVVVDTAFSGAGFPDFVFFGRCFFVFVFGHRHIWAPIFRKAVFVFDA